MIYLPYCIKRRSDPWTNQFSAVPPRYRKTT